MILYIDPGTGSMIFSLAIGVATTSVFLFRALILRLRFFLSGGKFKKIDSGKIPFVIFSDSKRYDNVFKPICDEFERRKVNLSYYTLSPDDPLLSENYEYVSTAFLGEGNKGLAKMNFLNADICLSTTPGVDVLQWKRSKNTRLYIHIPHLVGDLTTYRMFGLDFFDAVLLTGEYQGKDIRFLEKVRGTKVKELQVVGSTYMDLAKQKLDFLPPHKLNIASPVVLVAPSWGRSGILSKFGEELLDKLVETGWRIIVRPHPQSKTSEAALLKKLETRYVNIHNLEWNYDNDNLTVLNQADLMISDFSGVIFDYIFLFNRPVIYADTYFDSQCYDADWINHPLWTFEILKKIGVKLEKEQFSDIKNVVTGVLGNKNLFQEIQAAKSKAWQHEGKAAILTVDYLLNKGGFK